MKTANCTHSISITHPNRQSLAVRLFDRLLEWLERSRQRTALGRLEERLLADIGCDRASAAAEADKPFWRN
ncbi:MAG TPA: DUF1127 domain-containing protein [Magnetospirillum sp.]|jgi:uncharacterized protein YjiS (DUF1127 family)|nr:DUF1127 domain-containing protein [Magnetospirillum sp.]